MSLTTEDTFHIEEYKSLREGMVIKLKDRLEFNRWGLIGLAVLYAYIFLHPKFVLFLVPFFFSLVVIWRLYEQHKNVHRIAIYIRDHIERCLAKSRETADSSVPGGPGGWERYLGVPGPGEKTPWVWWPLPLWRAICVMTIILAAIDWFWPKAFAGLA